MAVGGAGWRLSALMGETKVRFNFEKKKKLVKIVKFGQNCAGWRLSALMGETKVRFNFEKKQQMVVSLLLVWHLLQRDPFTLYTRKDNFESTDSR